MQNKLYTSYKSQFYRKDKYCEKQIPNCLQLVSLVVFVNLHVNTSMKKASAGKYFQETLNGKKNKKSNMACCDGAWGKYVEVRMQVYFMIFESEVWVIWNNKFRPVIIIIKIPQGWFLVARCNRFLQLSSLFALSFFFACVWIAVFTAAGV